jgi:hypothetical protein
MESTLPLILLLLPLHYVTEKLPFMISNPSCLATKYFFKTNSKPLTLKLVPLHFMLSDPNHLAVPTPSATVLPTSENPDSFLNHLDNFITLLHTISTLHHHSLQEIHHHNRLQFPLHLVLPRLLASILPARFVAKAAIVPSTTTIAWTTPTKVAIHPSNLQP